jgi:hypothetical protein
MSEVQFDEVFQKLEKVIKEIISKKEYDSITGKKFYDMFKVEFGVFSSPAIRAGIKTQKSRIIRLFNENIDVFKEFCSYYHEDIDTGVRTIVNLMIDRSDNDELKRQWDIYKRKSNGGKRRKSIKTIKTKKNNLQNKKTRKTKKTRKWSQKYKDNINCKRPKGFSQKQHCKYGRKK